MKKLIQRKLKWLSKAVLAKYKPDIIGITGSVGKTGTKEAVYAALAGAYRVRRSIKNYNNEIGVPLTIIGAESPGRSLWGWLKLFLKAAKLLIIKDKNYPEVLVLEMGVDRIGDMKYLTRIVRCRVGVITSIGSSHLEYFGSLNKIKNEKAELIRSLSKEGWSVLNYDNESTRSISQESRARVITYGFSEKADIRAREVKLVEDPESGVGTEQADALPGLNFKLDHKGSYVPVFLPETIGDGAVYAALAASAVGVALGMNLVDISKALAGYRPPSGRMRIIRGIKQTLIVDDTYNSSPQSSFLALSALSRIRIEKGARRFAVLGDMLELGSYTEQGHFEVGEYAYKMGVDKLIVVGERSVDIMKGAKEAGMEQDDIFHFDGTEEAGHFIQDRIKKNDLILVKGSQGVRMEKVVEEIMADPLRAEVLLTRQGPEWKDK